MAFIDKKDPVVLNIKLTSKGRELLSEGNLNFKYYAIGDSEIDYIYNNEINAQLDLIGQQYSPFYSNILRPADINPSLLSFIPRNLSGDPYNVISRVPSTPTIIQNTAQPLGFFTISSGVTTFITDTDHIKQPDAMVKISGVTGGKLLSLFKAPTYIANVNEPEIGDLLLVKWTNKFGNNTTGYTVNSNYPTPYLIYKIVDLNGRLSTNNLIVEVDRELPNFNEQTGGTNNVVAGAMIYYNYINFTGSSIYNNYSTEYVNDAIMAFLQNCQCPTITFPFWNMSIIYTDNIIGVRPTDRNYGQYKSRTYGGFVSYIQNQAPTIKKLGVIHYTNSSPSNTYAEELYQNTPVLDLPTIMWHKSATKTLGAKFRAYGAMKTLTGITRSLNTTYYDLADLSGNVVGKVFNNLKLFVIEDQELLFAMSYKSNRSWTLPNYNVGINDNVIIGCNPCTVQYEITVTSPTKINGSDGSIYINNISYNFGTTILEVSGNTGIIFYEPVVGNKLVGGLSAGNYNVSIYDLGSPNCVVSSGVTIYQPTSILNLYNVTGTSSGLNPNFEITQNSPTNVTIYLEDIGNYYGTPKVAIKPYGILPNVGDWVSFNNYPPRVSFTTMTFTSPYTIYVRDSGSTFVFFVQKDYVAVGNPINSAFSVLQIDENDETYVNVTNYLLPINPSNNPIIGNIELSIYPTTSVPTNWVSGSTSGSGGLVSLHTYAQPNYTPNYYTIEIRERQNNIVVHSVKRMITFIEGEGR